MLDLFRKRGLSSIIYAAIIVATMLVFVIQFRPNSGQKTASLKEQCVATVRGWCVDPKDYRSSYRLLMPRDREGTPSPAKARQIGLSKLTLDGLVERELFLGEAEQIGLKVSDDEITDQIYDGWIRVSVPAADPIAASKLSSRGGQIYAGFKDQKTKQFDLKVYERTIRNLVGRSPQEFREEQSREILAAKMRDLVTAPVRVSETEAQDLYFEQNNTVTVDTVAVKQSWVKRWGVTVTPAEVDAWSKDPANAAEIEKVAKERETQDLPKENHIRHILIKTPPTPTEEDLQKAAAKLGDALARIKAGASFAEVAREVSEDKGSAFQGGDLGDKTDGFVAPFRDAANALKAGEMTKTAIQSQFGLHLIAKDDATKADAVKAAMAKDIARELLLKSKSLDKSREISLKIASDAQAGKKPEETIAAIVASFPKPAAQAAPMDISRLPKTDVDAGAADTATAKDDKKGADKKTKVASGPADDSDRPVVAASSPFNRRGEPVSGLSPEAQQQLMTFAFGAKDGEWRKEPIRADDGFVLVGLKEHKFSTADDFQKEKTTFVDQLLGAKKAEALAAHVVRLRDQAKDEIKVDESYIADLKGDGGAPGEEDEDEGP